MAHLEPAPAPWPQAKVNPERHFMNLLGQLLQDLWACSRILVQTAMWVTAWARKPAARLHGSPAQLQHVSLSCRRDKCLQSLSSLGLSILQGLPESSSLSPAGKRWGTEAEGICSYPVVASGSFQNESGHKQDRTTWQQEEVPQSKQWAFWHIFPTHVVHFSET